MPIPAKRLLPHRPPLLLLERLTACTELTATAETFFTAQSLFTAKDGRVDPVVMVELIAQTYAAFQGYGDLVHGRPVRKGFLVGARQVRIFAHACVGDLLRITVRTEIVFEGFAMVEGQVHRGEDLLAAGIVKLWVRDLEFGVR